MTYKDKLSKITETFDIIYSYGILDLSKPTGINNDWATNLNKAIEDLYKQNHISRDTRNKLYRISTSVNKNFPTSNNILLVNLIYKIMKTNNLL